MVIKISVAHEYENLKMKIVILNIDKFRQVSINQGSFGEKEFLKFLS